MLAKYIAPSLAFILSTVAACADGPPPDVPIIPTIESYVVAAHPVRVADNFYDIDSIIVSENQPSKFGQARAAEFRTQLSEIDAARPFACTVTSEEFFELFGHSVEGGFTHYRDNMYPLSRIFLDPVSGGYIACPWPLEDRLIVPDV